MFKTHFHFPPVTREKVNGFVPLFFPVLGEIQKDIILRMTNTGLIILSV